MNLSSISAITVRGEKEDDKMNTSLGDWNLTGTFSTAPPEGWSVVKYECYVFPRVIPTITVDIHWCPTHFHVLATIADDAADGEGGAPVALEGKPTGIPTLFSILMPTHIISTS
jgi:hypothetical protein